MDNSVFKMICDKVSLVDEFEKKGISCAVINLPWLNYVDEGWLGDVTKNVSLVVSLDNHYTTFGQGSLVGETLARAGSRAAFSHIGLDMPPQCGANAEVLAYHKLDALSLAERILAEVH